MGETGAGLTLDLAELRRLKDDIGRMPPSPLTRRGRVGAVLVGAVRRALFWVWPPLHAFLDVLCRMLERLTQMVTALDEKVGSLHSQQDVSEAVAMELADIRAHRAHMDEAQAELWLEVTKLKAQVAGIRASGREGSGATSL